MEYYYNNISKIRSALLVFKKKAIIFQDGKKNWIHMDSEKSTNSFHMILIIIIIAYLIIYWTMFFSFTNLIIIFPYKLLLLCKINFLTYMIFFSFINDPLGFLRNPTTRPNPPHHSLPAKLT